MAADHTRILLGPLDKRMAGSILNPAKDFYVKKYDPPVILCPRCHRLDTKEASIPDLRLPAYEWARSPDLPCRRCELAAHLRAIAKARKWIATQPARPNATLRITGFIVKKYWWV